MCLISVILPTFNGATRGGGKFLTKAIDSVLKQTYQEFELLIVNDGSYDKTEEICRSYSDKRIRYIHQENKGPASARNTGIKNSEGEYICFLDDDDYYYKNKLEAQIQFINSNNAYVAYSFVDIIDENGKYIGTKNNKYSNNILPLILRSNIINSQSSIIIRREVVERVGYFKEYLKGCEDWDFFIRIASNYNFYCLEKPFLAYRRHSEQLSHNYIYLKNMEYYWQIVLFENLKNLKLDAAEYFNNLYSTCAKEYFLYEDYKEFRRSYKIASAYGRNNFKLRMVYCLSFFPPIASYIRRLLFPNFGRSTPSYDYARNQ